MCGRPLCWGHFGLAADDVTAAAGAITAVVVVVVVVVVVGFSRGIVGGYPAGRFLALLLRVPRL
jgi:hypothetical protein